MEGKFKYNKAGSTEEQKKIENIAKQPGKYYTDNEPGQNVMIDLLADKTGINSKNQNIKDYIENIGSNENKTLPELEEELSECEKELARLNVLGENMETRKLNLSKIPNSGHSSSMDGAEIMENLLSRLENLAPRYKELDEKAKKLRVLIGKRKSVSNSGNTPINPNLN